MKLCIGTWVLLFLCLAPLTLSQDYDDTRAVNVEEWKGSSGLETFKDVERKEDNVAGDEEIPKRVRPRNGGKRRRRLRKRPRTTEAPPAEEAIDNLDGAEQIPQEYFDKMRRVPEEGETTPQPDELPKRRPGKRRRRPHRRYQEVDQVNEGESEGEIVKPPRRRRKGGRKRIKPERVESLNNEEVQETTTILEGMETINENRYPVEIPEIKDEGTYIEQKKGNITNTSTTTSTTTTTTTTTEVPFIFKTTSRYITLKKEIENPKYNVEEITRKLPIFNSRPVTSRNLIIPTTEVESIESQMEDKHDENGFGNKIFDRRNLFSKSRRLPETSAVIRRRLVPQKNNSELNHLRIINPLANLESELDKYQPSSKNEITPKVDLPEGYTDQPEIIEPKKLLEKVKVHSITSTTSSPTTTSPTTTSTEEPNYPKFESQKKYSTARRSTTPQTTTIEVNYEQENVTEKIVRDITTESAEATTIKSEPNKLENIQSEIKNNSNVKPNVANDSIIDLLKTESSRLSKILELRNMTIEQLLEHRERGSSKFHLSDIFGSESKAQINKENKELPLSETTATTTTTETIISSIEQIQFPEEEVLGSFPKFISDQIEKHTQHQPQKEIGNSKKLLINDHREPRHFESMPAFTTKAPEPPQPYPTWRIIPNPKLKPVSIHGNFEEIKISDIIPSDKPMIGNDIEEIYLLDDREDFVHHKNKLADTLSAETVKSQHNTLSTLKRIPVSVKSAIIISAAILVLAIFGFLSVLISCRVRQKKARLRAKQDILCEHLQNEDFMTSQQSLSPVLNKHQRGPVFNQSMHANHAPNRHYYLWRTLRKTFQYD